MTPARPHSSRQVKLKSNALPLMDHKTLGRYVPQLKRLLPHPTRYVALVPAAAAAAAARRRNYSYSDEEEEAAAEEDEEEDEEEEAEECSSSSSSSGDGEFEGDEVISDDSSETSNVGQGSLRGRSDGESDFIG